MNPKEHWLDYAEGKCDKKLVLEVKILMKILLLFVPLPLFWGLFGKFQVLVKVFTILIDFYRTTRKSVDVSGKYEQVFAFFGAIEYFIS